MKIKVLHLVDVYLPRTMNWVEGLLDSSNQHIQHFVYPTFLIKSQNLNNYILPNIFYQHVNYPISTVEKIKNKLYYQKKLNAIKKIIAEQKIQALHFHFGNMAVHYLKFINELKLPFFISLYGYDYEKLPKSNPKFLHKYLALAKLGGIFIVEGQYSLRLLIEYGIPKQQIQIVHLLFDKRIPRTQSNFNTPISLVQIATYTPKKGQDIILQALAKIPAGVFTIDFYGEIVQQKYYDSLINITKLYPNITARFHGLLNSIDYKSRLQTPMICLNLSQTTDDFDTEGGSPLFIKDALLAGKPVISTHHCDIPETIIHNFNGWLIAENNVNETVQLLLRISRLTIKEYTTLCTNAMHSICCNANGNISGEEIIQVYKTII